MAKKILMRKWWQLLRERRSPWRKLEIRWESVQTETWISSRFCKCSEIIQVDREWVEWAQIPFSNYWWRRRKRDMTMMIQMKLMEKVMNLDQITLETKVLGLVNLNLMMYISQASRWTKTTTRDKKKGRKESHLQELMAQALCRATSLEAGPPRDSPHRKMQDEGTVSRGQLTRLMMRIYQKVWSKDGINENPTRDLR